jgi:hypothetical protein
MIRPTLRSVATSLTIGALWFAGAWTLAACRDAVPAPVTERAQLTLVVAGLPRGTGAGVQISGPSGFSRSVDSTTVLGDLLPGRYTVRAGEVRAQGVLWSASPSSFDAQLVAGDTLFAAISYAVSSGAVRLIISGLPSGAAASVRVLGPNGLQRFASSSVTFAELPPGEYTVVADSIQSGGTGWRGPVAQVVQVPASLTPVSVSVVYRRVSGRMVFIGSGTPADARATARLQGPLLTDTLVSSGTVLELPVGSHVITPLPALRSGSTPPRLYVPVLRAVTRALTDAAVDTVVVPYTPNAGPINLTLDNVMITQAVQRSDNGIPLVAGREALLRAFVVADREGLVPPRAVVRLYESSTLLGTLPMTPPGALPLVTREGLEGQAYTARLASDLVRNSLRVMVEIDPDSSIGEVQRGDNVWPSGGTPRALTTVSVPPFVVRFVPVVIAGRAPELSAGRVADMLNLARAMWPLASIDFDIRAPLVSAVASLHAADADGSWSTVLSELRALRVLDGAPAGMHYYGVVSPTYSNGVFGLGLVGSPTSVGWDRDDAAQVATHEWGHNFGRTHSPCGDPPGIDTFYPTVGGATASVGWDQRSNRIVSPLTSDIMGYCANAWVSEYTYTRALAFRQNTMSTRMTATLAAPSQPQRLLLVAGYSRQGRVHLDVPRALGTTPPAHSTTMMMVHDASVAAPPGTTHRLELLDTAQHVMRRYWLVAEAMDHEPDAQVFAAAVPEIAGLRGIRVTHLRYALGAATVLVGEQQPAAALKQQP